MPILRLRSLRDAGLGGFLYGALLYGAVLSLVHVVHNHLGSSRDALITFAGFNLLQVIAIVHGVYQDDRSLIVGMIASLITCGTVTCLTLFYRIKRKRAEVVAH